MPDRRVWNSPDLTTEDIERLDKLDKEVEERARNAPAIDSSRERLRETLHWNVRSEDDPKPGKVFDQWREDHQKRLLNEDKQETENSDDQ